MNWGRSSSALVRGGIIAALGLVTLFGTACSRRPGAKVADHEGGGSGAMPDTPSVRIILARGTDLTSCKNAVNQLNRSLGGEGGRKISPLDAEHHADFEKIAKLGADEFKEIERSSYGPLDAHHLDGCFLLGDAARSLGLLDSDKNLSTLEKATIAFDWVVRQVRLDRSSGERDQTPQFIPPQFVLRRGYGASQDRAVCLLSLLDQFGCEGCLLRFPRDGKDADDKTPLRVCGVRIRDGDHDDICLFDTWLGMPIPAADGKGVATLADVQKQPHLYATLGIEAADSFAVTPAAALLVCPLSALAPRLAELESELQGSGMTIHLANLDLKSKVQRFEKSLKAAGVGDTPVLVPGPLVNNLRAFLASSEGGIDAKPQVVNLSELPGYVLPNSEFARQGVYMLREQRLNLAMIDWRWLGPPLQRLDYRSPQHNSNLGLAPRKDYIDLFMPFFDAPKREHDLLLRGQLKEAVTKLTEDCENLPDLARRLSVRPTEPFAEILERWRNSRADQSFEGNVAEDLKASTTSSGEAWKELINSELDKELGKWSAKVDKVYTDYLKVEGKHPERAEELLAELNVQTQLGRDLWYPYLAATTATPRHAMAAYQLALCRHEMAVRADRQAALAKRGDDRDKATQLADAAASAWLNAADGWRTFTLRHPGSSATADARLSGALAEAKCGNIEAAVTLLTENPEQLQLSKSEIAARTYLATRMKD